MLIMLAESRFLRRKLVRHPVDAGLRYHAEIEMDGQQGGVTMKMVVPIKFDLELLP